MQSYAAECCWLTRLHEIQGLQTLLITRQSDPKGHCHYLAIYRYFAKELSRPENER